MTHQSSIVRPVTVSGVGVHSGAPASLTVRPAGENVGVVFVRTDVTDRAAEIPALVTKVTTTELGTNMSNAAGVSVATVEHFLAACAGLGIDNVIAELDGPELPILDGSSKPFVVMLEQAGVARLAPPHAASPEAGGPGPGDYELLGAPGRPGKGVTIPHAARDWPVRDSSPGPANYDSHLALDHLLNKRGAGTALPKAGALDRVPEVPGPGQYETNRSSLSKVGQAAMPKAPREASSKYQTPGPADYEPSRVSDKSRGVSFPHAGKDGRKEDTPGPGHYEFTPTVPNLAPYARPKA